MKIRLIIFLTLLVFSAQSQDSTNYSSSWQKVYQYEVQDLPRSARQVVDSIYSQARQQENVMQQIRSLVYLSKFRNILEEEAQSKIMEDFNQELLASSGVQRAVLASFMAEFFEEYLTGNFWKIRQRTSLSVNEEKDFRTWSEDQFKYTIDSLHHLSLSDTLLLQQTSLDEIEEILYNRADQRHLRPSLYDLLVHRALDWYENKRQAKTVDVSGKLLRNPAYRDTTMTGNLVRIMDLYSSLMHLRQADTAALVTLWTERSHYLSDKATNPDLPELRALLYDSLYTLYSSHPAGTLLQYELANDLYEQGNQYSPDLPDLQYAWREAKQLAEQATREFPDSFGAEKCRALISRITSSSLDAMMESYIPIGRNSPILIQFRNTDSVRVSVRRISATSLQRSDGKLHDYLSLVITIIKSHKSLPA